MRILDDPRLRADLLAGSSRAEVGIAGTLEIGGIERAISGKIDRLAVTDREVLIVDYKTNRPAPIALDEVPRGLCRAARALSRAAAAALSRADAVGAALLFTETPLLIAVPAAAMDDALAQLTRA